MSDQDDEELEGGMIVWPLDRLARLMRAREHDGELNPAQWEALRYLSRANRFSNSPGALTRYLGATKGTISQTVMALERKGFIAKSARSGERRSVSLNLTPKGQKALSNDPWSELGSAADDLGGKTRRRLAKGLRELLADELKRGGLASFGTCTSCRYFREKGRDKDVKGPHHCMLFDQPLSPADARHICVEHTAR
jgi:DNA-binding MarR family transcriptional regulator